MDDFIIDIEVPQKPIDEVLTSENHIVLNFDDLEILEILTDITLDDLDLEAEITDVEDFKEDDFQEDDFHDNHYESIPLDDIDIDFDENFE